MFSPTTCTCLSPRPPPAALARDELAPLGAAAYPDAYPEFKTLLLMLVQGHDPARQAASRDELAQIMFHTVERQNGGCPRISGYFKFISIFMENSGRKTRGMSCIF